jgi:hypothetical protein
MGDSTGILGRPSETRRSVVLCIMGKKMTNINIPIEKNHCSVKYILHLEGAPLCESVPGDSLSPWHRGCLHCKE